MVIVFRCSECDRGFVHADELAAHVSVTHVAWVPYSCALGCEHFYAPTLRLLLEHCAAEHPGVAADYACDADEDKTRRLNAILARSLWTAAEQASAAAAHMEGVNEGMYLAPSTRRLVVGAASQEPRGESAAPPSDVLCANVTRASAGRDVNAAVTRSTQTAAALVSDTATHDSAAVRQPVVESAAPPTTAVTPPPLKPTSGDDVDSMECRLCGATSISKRSGFRMTHVCDRHVDGLVYHCSACNKAGKTKTGMEKHISSLRRASTAGGHRQAVVLSNRDQLKEAVRAAFLQCFGEAAASRSIFLKWGSRKGEQSLAAAAQKMDATPAVSAASTSAAIGAVECSSNNVATAQQVVMDADG